jgi:DNA repair protein RecN (Recombination protein N)
MRLLSVWPSTIASGTKAAASWPSISSRARRAARADLLQYQLKELNEFNPLPGEFEQIDEEYKRLANSGQLLSTCQHALTVLADGEEANLQSQLYTAKQLVSELVGMDSKLSACWICWKRRPFSSAKPATNCATITTVWISIRTVCSSLSSASPGKSRWRVNIRSCRKSCRRFIRRCWKSSAAGRQRGSLESLSQQVVEHHQLALETARSCTLRQASADELTQLITESMLTFDAARGLRD